MTAQQDKTPLIFPKENKLKKVDPKTTVNKMQNEMMANLQEINRKLASIMDKMNAVFGGNGKPL